MNGNEWFKDWFDTPLYHTLYKHRDFNEASQFIDKIIDHLAPPPNATILDLACGKGRHAYYMAQKGYNVTGIDLSLQSIKKAKEMEHHFLHFDTHDMRLVYRNHTFDYICNLFTSFGYFDDEKDNIATVNAIASGLKSKGKVIIDFMNVKKVIRNLVEKELKKIDNISFRI